MVSDPDLDLTRVTCDADAERGGGADADQWSPGGDSCNEQVCHTQPPPPPGRECHSLHVTVQY